MLGAGCDLRQDVDSLIYLDLGRNGNSEQIGLLEATCGPVMGKEGVKISTSYN